MDYLLSEPVELQLAQSKSRQISVGPVDEGQLPRAVRQMKRWAADSYPLADGVQVRAATLEWLQSEYLQ